MTSYYSVGTVTLVTGSKTVVGTGTAWQTALITGGNIIVEAAGNVLPIASVDDDDTITAELAWTGASGTYNYAIQRDTAYLKTLDTNSQNLAYLLSELRQGTIFKYDVAGPDSDRNIYDAKPKGFSYLSTDGTNPQLYVKLSATSGDWAGPFAYGTGPQGPQGEKGDTGDTGLTGINNRGIYSAGTAYATRDGVLYNGSYWYATQATTGNAPPTSSSTTSNTWWQLVAAKGTDGTGTGDVVGPSSAVDARIAVFDGTTGKLLKDSGKTLAEVVPANNSVTNSILADMATATIKGRATAGSGDPEDLTATQVLTLLKTVGAFAKDNILGTVSQASGVPTGAIIETGSNANGSYMRFANGLQICFCTPSINYAGSSTTAQVFTSPATFSGNILWSGITGQAFSGTTTSQEQYAAGVAGCLISGSGSSYSIYTASATKLAVTSPNSLVVLVGRWF